MANRLYIRRFLNKRGHHAGGYILVAVEDTTKRKTDGYDWTDIEFTIADCGRQIGLSFEVTPRELANSLYKVDVLLDALHRFRAALVVEGRLAAERAKNRNPTSTPGSEELPREARLDL